MGQRRLIDFLNSISDRDQLWSPFLRLRPEKNVTITFADAVQIALYFGLSYGAVYDILTLIVKPDPSLLQLLIVPIIAVPLYGIVFGLFFIVPWNLRAKHLQGRPVDPPSN